MILGAFLGLAIILTLLAVAVWICGSRSTGTRATKSRASAARFARR
jgi:hypothetical protein